MKILFIEDAPRLRETVAASLTRMGHNVDTASDGETGYAMGKTEDYDVVVLDRMLPQMGGLDVLDGWRRSGIETPVLLLTALDSVPEKIYGLSSGADDYLTKPFDLNELVARLEALTRRKFGRSSPLRDVGPLRIDTAAKSATLDSGRRVELTARDFSLLELLSRHPGRVYSRAEIENRLYSDLDSPLSNAVDAAVYSLRRKLVAAGLDDASSFVRTRRGLGYVLET